MLCRINNPEIINIQIRKNFFDFLWHILNPLLFVIHYEMVHIECSLLIPLSLKFEINVEFNISENKAKCKQSVVASCQLKHADKKQPLVERGLL